MSGCLHYCSTVLLLLLFAGTEMGQGLHTKMVQVAGQTLGISLEKGRDHFTRIAVHRGERLGKIGI